MKQSCFRVLFLLLASLTLYGPVHAQDDELVIGIAKGYPPFQYTLFNGEPGGIDAEVARLVFKELKIPFSFTQENWDDLYLGLLHKSGAVDLLCGTEVNDLRKKYFDFSIPYYQRTVVIFVRQESPYQRLSELKGKLITGDRGGQIEQILNRNTMRITNTGTKEESFRKLRDNQVEAVIAPLDVGNWISKELKLRVRVLPEKDPGSPVAFAVAKGNSDLAARLSQALEKLQKSGAIELILARYR